MDGWTKNPQWYMYRKPAIIWQAFLFKEPLRKLMMMITQIMFLLIIKKGLSFQYNKFNIWWMSVEQYKIKSKI